jgi:hypothetical protein
MQVAIVLMGLRSKKPYIKRLVKKKIREEQVEKKRERERQWLVACNPIRFSW